MEFTIKCAIIDDDRLSLKMLEQLCNESGFLEVISTFDNSIEASKFLARETVDLIFLDVEMPDLSGLELAETFGQDQMVIIVSGKEDYAVKAFDLNVVDYLVKPVSRPRFLKAVNKVMKMAGGKTVKESVDKIYVKVDNQLVGISLNDIFYIEALADYIKIHTPEKRYTVYSSMKGIENRLPVDKFMRVHRSFIVNLNRIESLEDNTLYVDGTSIPVGGTYQKKLMGRLNLL